MTPREFTVLPVTSACAVLVLSGLVACGSSEDDTRQTSRVTNAAVNTAVSTSAGPTAGPAAGASVSVSSSGTLPRIRLAPAFPQLKFTRPIFAGHAGDGSNRLFVVEQYGRIKVLPNVSSASDAEVFLDINEKVYPKHNEEGLLSLAFHPKYKENGRFFVYYSAKEPRRGVLAEYTVSAEDPNRADPASEKVILEVEQPWGNHNGATVLFGPDGYLYFSLGDGGYANDPLDSGQDLSTLLGTVLRLDIDKPSKGPDGDLPYSIPSDNPFVGKEDARGEIWAYGLRNIWRMSFDRETGDLWAGDVGQNKWEEIDLIVKGGNYGWRFREGFHQFRKGEADGTFIDPIVEYSHDPSTGGLSVTGGYVYRGSTHEALKGIYFYADYVTGRIWGLRYENGSLTENAVVHEPKPTRYISSFGEDEAGELYVVAFDKVDRKGGTGRVYRVVPE